MAQAREKILVVDDEERIVNIVQAYLEREGFRVLTAGDGRTALDLAERERPDLVVLDLMLPEISGWDVCRQLCRNSSIPVIMLTARDDETDKIVGLELGADDYITKPFSPKELVARVRAVLRRNRPAPTDGRVLTVGRLSIDVDRHEVRRDDEAVPLTPSEFGILAALAGSPGRVFTRLQLLERVQGEAYEGYERTIDSHVKNLRQKVENDPRRPHYILTVFGIGYKFAERPDA